MKKINKERINKSKWIAVTIVFILMVSSVTAFATSDYPVRLEYDNTVEVVKTRSYDPKKIIEKAGVKLNPNDKINLDKFKAGEPSSISIERAVNANVYSGAILKSKVNMVGTVKEAISKAGINIKDGDTVNIPLDSKLKEGMDIIVTGKDFISIIDEDKIYSCESSGETLGEILKKLNITLDSDDEISKPLDSVPEKGSSIEILRVEFKVRTVIETVKHKTINVDDNGYYIGQSRVIKPGVDGKNENTYSDKYVNGKLSESTLTKTKVIKKPVNKVVGHGTRVHVKNGIRPISKKRLPSRYGLSSDGIPTNYLKVFRGGSTAYTCNIPSYHGSGNTATGAKAQSGLVAVNPRQIPYGTEMYIVSSDGKKVYGYAIAADTGGFAKGNRTIVDVYMDTANECYQWGRRDVCIYILKWGK
ncbi:MAG: 3D domain-containing protein [Clostridia bacterium]|nr:3D domain-containing protein [Clostridia bacterium]